MSSISSSPPIEWHPALLIQQPSQGRDFALIILNQPLNHLEVLKRIWQNSSFHVAADGGANRLYDSNQRVLKGAGNSPVDGSCIFSKLDAIIGDLDSLTETTRNYFTKASDSVEVIHDPDQYSTDFTKAVRHIRKTKGPVDIVAMGGLGGRVDQGLSQLHHLYLFQTSSTYAEGRLYLLSDENITFLLKAGRHRIHVREPTRSRSQPERENGDAGEDVFDKYVGIVPVKEPSVITLKGFEWDVEDWLTEFGGQISTSNHVLPETEVLEVQTSKDVVFTISLKTRSGEGGP